MQDKNAGEYLFWRSVKEIKNTKPAGEIAFRIVQRNKYVTGMWI